jgi:hypothetical protein
MKSQIVLGLLGLGGLTGARKTPLDDPLVNRLHGHQLASMRLERREAAHESRFEARDEAPAEPRFLSNMTESESFCGTSQVKSRWKRRHYADQGGDSLQSLLWMAMVCPRLTLTLASHMPANFPYLARKMR